MMPHLFKIIAVGVSLFALMAPTGLASADTRTTVISLPSPTRLVPLQNRVRLLARRPLQTPPETLPPLPGPMPRPQTSPTPIDDRPFWAAIARGDLARAQSIQIELRAADKPWPEADRALALLTLLQAEADYKQAAAEQDWRRVITLADRQPQLVSCDRSYNFWPLGDAYHNLGRTAKLTELYGSVVGACSSASDRLTAIEHAFQQLPPATVADLLLLERPRGRDKGANERLEALEYRLGGARLSAGLADPTDPAGPTKGDDIAAIEDSIGAAVMARQDTATATSLGWSNFRTGRLARAQSWFTAALEWSGDPGAAEGLTNTLLRRDRPNEAAIIVDTYLADDPRAQSLRQRIHASIAGQALSDGAYDQAATHAATARDLGATGPGVVLVEAWALLQSGQAELALAAFADALAQGGGDDATLGLVRANLALDRLDDAGTAAADLPPSKSAAVVAEISIRLADRAYEQGRYGDSILHAQRAQASPDFAVDALAIEAWSRFRLDDLKASQTLFEWLYRTDPRQDYADGLFLSFTHANQQPRVRDLADELGGALAERVQRAEIFGG
ncbi:MAG: hypothetical protein ACTSX7_05840 [Alphaproteobacteria bacterium]